MTTCNHCCSYYIIYKLILPISGVLLCSFINKETDSNKSSNLPEVTQDYVMSLRSLPVPGGSKANARSPIFNPCSCLLILPRYFDLFLFLLSPLSLLTEGKLRCQLAFTFPFPVCPHSSLPPCLCSSFFPKAFLQFITDGNDSPCPSHEEGR